MILQTAIGIIVAIPWMLLPWWLRRNRDVPEPSLYGVPKDSKGVVIKVGQRVMSPPSHPGREPTYGIVTFVYPDCNGIIDCRVRMDGAREEQPVHGSTSQVLPRPNIVVRALARIGLTSIRRDNTVHWPFHIAPFHMWRYYVRHEPWFGIFRNLPGVVKWVPGRLLPFRWGFRFMMIEVGDRGSAWWPRT